MLQKNAFGRKKFEFHARVQKCHFFEPLHEVQIFFSAKSILLKHYENGNKKNLSQGPQDPGFMQKKVRKGDFLKKPSRELKNCKNATF